ncbi:MAG: hypothetical protein ACE15D_03890, partial [Candidatus Eisenbacteria bacterium]
MSAATLRRLEKPLQGAKHKEEKENKENRENQGGAGKAALVFRACAEAEVRTADESGEAEKSYSLRKILECRSLASAYFGQFPRSAEALLGPLDIQYRREAANFSATPSSFGPSADVFGVFSRHIETRLPTCYGSSADVLRLVCRR